MHISSIPVAVGTCGGFNLVIVKIGDRLRELRDGAGLTQTELANKAGVSLSIVQKMEAADDMRGRRTTWRKMLEALGSSLVAFESDGDGWAAEHHNIDPYSERAVPEIPLFDLPLAAGHWVELDGEDSGEGKRPGVLTGATAIALGLFRVRIRGDSMQPAYPTESIVEFRCLREGHEGPMVGGDYYVQLSDDRATFKRLESTTDDDYIFRAINRRKFPKPIIVSKGLVVRMARAVAKVEVIVGNPLGL